MTTVNIDGNSNQTNLILGSENANIADNEGKVAALVASVDCFNYGVASGDPLADRVIIWTHCQDTLKSDDLSVDWELSLTDDFASVFSTGKAVSTAENGNTMKVDVTGLSANTTYYYRFKYVNTYSMVGTTKTLPIGSVTTVKLAVSSCAMYSRGYFNAYKELGNSDVDAVLHLGDYIYEYGNLLDTTFVNTPDVRQTYPITDCFTLENYRDRYKLVRTDEDLQLAHQKKPFINILDDHEVANGSWSGGAKNHTIATQGPYDVRKAVAYKAWFEWIPIRESTDRIIYRNFEFGDLVSLYMLDGSTYRDKAYDTEVLMGDMLSGVNAITTVISAADRVMLGATQTDWLQSGVTNSTSKYQLLGNGKLLADDSMPLHIMYAGYTAPDTVPALVGAFAALSDASKNDVPVVPQGDGWNQYPVERLALLDFFQQMEQNKHLISVAGDSHNAFDLNVFASDGAKVGKEFGTQSVSNDYDVTLAMPNTPPAQLAGLFGVGMHKHLTWTDLSQRGYLRLDITPAGVTPTWNFMDIKSKTYDVTTHTATYDYSTV